MVAITEATEYDVQVVLAEELLEQEDYSGAAFEAKKVLDQLEPHIATIAQAAVTRGQALMTQTMNEMRTTHKLPTSEALERVFESYKLAHKLNPDCDETKFNLTQVSQILRGIPPPNPPKQVESADFDVIVVGAGAAGIGTALVLTETFGLNKSRVVLMERGARVGESFRLWPAEMKFISPSFNQQGWTNSFDLNAISKGTSPAFSLHTEHPSGKEYASYLEAIVTKHKLNVRTLTEVVSIRAIGETKELPLFSVDVQSVASNGNGDPINNNNLDVKQPVMETLKARYIVWAAGEFQYPRVMSTETAEGNKEENKSDSDKKEEGKIIKQKGFPGMDLCLHNSQVRSWATLPGDDFLIIGGYESGIDAAINLSHARKGCKVLASTPCWSIKTTDPSAELAPYTAARLRDVLAPGFSPNPQLLAPLRVVKVEKAEERGGFHVTAEWQAVKENSKKAPSLRNLVNHDIATKPQGKEGSTLVLYTQNPPVLCTGFVGSVAASASHLFEFAKNEDDDEHGDDSGDMEVCDSDDDEHLHVEVIKEGGVQINHTTSKKKKKGCLEGAPLLTENDESTKIPGVYLVGPSVSHGTLSFCFVYKFRQRFAVVAKAICKGLGIDTRAAVSESRRANMFLEDFSCCADTCGDVC